MAISQTYTEGITEILTVNALHDFLIYHLVFTFNWDNDGKKVYLIFIAPEPDSVQIQEPKGERMMRSYNLSISIQFPPIQYFL